MPTLTKPSPRPPPPPAGAASWNFHTKMDIDVGAVALKLSGETGAGAACCVLRSADGVASARIAAAGVRQVDGGSRCEAADRWHLGSNTKAMTADLCGLAVQDGLLDWASTVGGVLGADVACAYADVTLRQLLSHTSGFPPGDCPPDAWRHAWSLHFSRFPRQQPAAQQLKFVRHILSRVPPARLPGPPSAYSNQNYAVAAAMLARATGVAWEELARTRLFEPLGMSSAGLGPAGARAASTEAARCHPWGHRGSGPGAMTPAHPDATNPASDNPDAIAPAGKVHASIADWARFVAAHIDAVYASQCLGMTAETLARLHTAPGGADHACGWIVGERDWAGGTALWHSGSNTCNYCTVWAAPEQGRALLVACNACPPGAHEAVHRAIEALLGLSEDTPIGLS